MFKFKPSMSWAVSRLFRKLICSKVKSQGDNSGTASIGSGEQWSMVNVSITSK